MGRSLNDLALLYEAQGRYAEAEPLYKRALAIDEKALGPDDPSVGTSLNNLAELYRAQGRYAEAEPPQTGTHHRRKDAGSRPLDVGRPLNNLALLYHAQGRCRGRFLQRASPSPRRRWGPTTRLWDRHSAT